MTWKIEQVKPDEAAVKAIIDPWLAACPSATIFHTTNWNLIVQEVFQSTCRYFLAYDRHRLVGLLPCHFVKIDPWLTICYSPPRLYEVSYGGPVAIGNESAGICAALVKMAGRTRIGVIVDIFNSPQNTEWAYRVGWRRIALFESAYVDLRQPLENIWSLSLNNKRRNMIRKAEKKGVEIREVGLNGLDQYHSLVDQMTRRAGLSTKPRLYYQRILEMFGPRDQARLLLAYSNGDALAGGIFLRDQTTAYYWISATASDAPNLGQGELLQWNVIQWAKKAGCLWYDLVGVEQERLPHIATFKLGFTRNILPFHHVSYVTFPSRVIRRLQRMLGRPS